MSWKILDLYNCFGFCQEFKTAKTIKLLKLYADLISGIVGLAVLDMYGLLAG